MKSITKKLAEFAVQSTYGDFPEDVINQAKRCFIDTIGVTLAAVESPTAKVLTGLIQDLGGKEQASIIRSSIKTTVVNASLVNGAMGHVFDFDDLHNDALTHTSTVLVPAALSGGEWKRRNGEEVITSFVVGFEAVARVSMAAGKGPHQLELGWHPTSTMGRIGAAVCFGRLLGLDVLSMAASMGIAATTASGLRRVFGTMTKHFNAGKPAHDGVLAALLAHRGFSAPTDILEGDDGLCNVLARRFDGDQVLDGLGERYEILNNSFKAYPACGQTHAVIDACLDIFRKPSFRSSDIKEVICEVNPVAPEVAGKRDPRDPNEAKFSLHYCAARALMGDVSMRSFRPEEIQKEDVKKLMKCIEITTNPAFSIASAHVEVTTQDGRKAKSKIDGVKGSPSNPMTDDEMDSKFMDLALPVLKDEEKTKNILHMLRALETVKDVGNVVRLLA